MLLIIYILAEEIDFEIDHLRNFWTSVTLTLDWVTRHIFVYHSLTKFRSNRKNFLCTGGPASRLALLHRTTANKTVVEWM